MESHRSDGFSGDGAFEIEYEKSENNVNEIVVIGSPHQRISAKNNEGVGDGINISPDTKSESISERKLFQFDVGSQLPNQMTRNIDCSKFVENMFDYPPFLSNCNYTHVTEELGKLTPNWEEEITVAPKEEQVQSSTLPNSMSEHCIDGLTEKGNEYGENCYSIDEYSHEDRKSEAICLVPGYGGQWIIKSSNWKTRLCNKWKTNGWCIFGDRCHFAHGSSELRDYDGRLLNKEVENHSTLDAKKIALPVKASIFSTGGVAHAPHVSRSNRVGVPPQRLPTTAEVPTRRWKGPNKISKIYGDWIDDLY